MFYGVLLIITSLQLAQIYIVYQIKNKCKENLRKIGILTKNICFYGGNEEKQTIIPQKRNSEGFLCNTYDKSI